MSALVHIEGKEGDGRGGGMKEGRNKRRGEEGKEEKGGSRVPTNISSYSWYSFPSFCCSDDGEES